MFLFGNIAIGCDWAVFRIDGNLFNKTCMLRLGVYCVYLPELCFVASSSYLCRSTGKLLRDEFVIWTAKKAGNSLNAQIIHMSDVATLSRNFLSKTDNWTTRHTHRIYIYNYVYICVCIHTYYIYTYIIIYIIYNNDTLVYIYLYIDYIYTITDRCAAVSLRQQEQACCPYWIAPLCVWRPQNRGQNLEPEMGSQH